MATIDQAKKAIRDYLKEIKSISTALGELTVEQCVGEGGNALVYKASWGKKMVAFKILAEDCSAQIPSKAKRFFTEVREIIQLSDTTAVVPIFHFDFLQINELKFPFMIMKFFPYTLKSWVKENPIATIGELQPILKQIINSIEVIHQNNIIHRDLKPENILVSSNNRLVLGDFGIAWFDPDHYDKLTKTSPGDRLANYAFSAPEQFIKDNEVKPSSDIYALGQIIQWLVTGETLKGTGRTNLSSKHPSFSIIDPIIDKLLQQNPLTRPQSIPEVKQLIQNASEPKKKNEHETVLNNLRYFNEILRESFPGYSGIFNVSQKETIDKLMSLLAKNLNDLELWWTQGYSNTTIPEIVKLDDETWLIEGEEAQIEEVWINKTSSYDRDFILIKTKPMAPFGIYEYYPGNDYEEAGFYKGNYITRSEFDDGYAIINGDTVKLDRTTEVRTRHLITEYKFIATNYHSILIADNDEIVYQVYEKLKKTSNISREIFSPFKRMKIHPISLMHK